MSTARRAALFSAWIVAIAGASGCGDDDASTPGDAGVDAQETVPDRSCGRPEIPGNEIGVGQFCSPSGPACPRGAPLCLAVLAPEEEQWYCVRICSMDSQCGTDARCVGDERGMACVPTRCLGGVDDDAGAGDGGASDAGVVDGGAADAGGSGDDAGAADAS